MSLSIQSRFPGFTFALDYDINVLCSIFSGMFLILHHSSFNSRRSKKKLLRTTLVDGSTVRRFDGSTGGKKWNPSPYVAAKLFPL